MRKPMPLVEKILAVLIALVLIVSPFAAHAVESAAQEEQDAPVCVPILMYHEVKPNKSGKDAIQPWELENDLKWLEQNGYTTVTMADLFAYVDDGTPLPKKPVVLSFDDGYYNNYVYALPLLRQYGAKIVLSVLGKNTDDFSEYPSENIDYAHMTWEQLAELRDSGLVEIQNHTYDLHAHTKQRIGCTQSAGESDAAYETLLTDDLLQLQAEMEDHLGITPDAFAYPYGKYSDTTDSILRKLGFRATLTCDYGVNLLTRDPDCLYRLKRVSRPHGQSIEQVLDGAFQTLRWK